MGSREDPKPVSAEWLLSQFDRLGIPHFQRGLLWKRDSVALLLESLYHGTPCGTVLLWKPLHPAEHGIPLGGGTPDLMIVDGQQRLRSLHRVTTSGASQNEEWYLNLARVPAAATAAGLKANDLDLFHRHTADHGDAAPPPGCVRLRSIWAPNWDDVRSSLPTPALFDVLERADVFTRVQGMLTRELFWLAQFDETTHSNDLAAVVRIYNRINSAGVQVEPEEKAYAALVAAHPDFAGWVRGLFEEVHGSNSAGMSGLSDRDEGLRREQERRFGFKLFVRVFVQYWVYHCRDTKGENSLSFELLTNPRVMSQLTDTANREHIEYLLTRSREAIRFVHSVLQKNLFCDSYAFLPETRALVPIFQLLVRFPGIMTDVEARGEIQWLLLRLMLAERMTQREVVIMVRAVNGALLAADAFETLREKLPQSQAFNRALAKALAEGRSITDRHLLLLYWLTRRNAATDFSYRNLKKEDEEQIRKKYSTEVAVSAAVVPEKQHILPFSMIRRVFGIAGRGRPAAHEANNVGNMTYISQLLNDFDGGLGSKCIDVSLEGDNLSAHMLTSVAGILQRLRAKQEWSEKDKPLVRRFMALRRQAIAEGLTRWLEELGSVRLGERIEPDRRRLDPDLEDLIRAAHYPDALEDALLACLRTYKFGSPTNKDGVLSFRLRAKKSTRTLLVKLNSGGISVKGAREPAARLTERFRKAAKTFAEDRKRSTIFRFSLPVDTDAAAIAFAAFSGVDASV